MAEQISKIFNHCKNQGFFFPASEIYGGVPGLFDYGPLGVELKNNLRAAWWKSMVLDRNDIEGLDASILTHSKLLDYSGHIEGYNDLMIKCRSCGGRMRADHLKSKHCVLCGSPDLTEPEIFNLMLSTNVGLIDNKDSQVFLRPATAQNTFANFQNIYRSSGQSLPFGIAQIGKAFRNEISPDDFLFRMREFEQMELQYFIPPGSDDYWHDYWLQERLSWWQSLGLSSQRLSVDDVKPDELAHYSKRTFDIYYSFADGFKGEIEGIANRTDYDLSCHSNNQQDLNIQSVVNRNNESLVSMAIVDAQTSKQIVPFVIEPASGLDRGCMAFLCEAYDESVRANGSRRCVLRLSPSLSPIKIGIILLNANQVEQEGVGHIKRSLQRHVRGRIVLEFVGTESEIVERHDAIGTPFLLIYRRDASSISRDWSVISRSRDEGDEEMIGINRVEEFFFEKFRNHF